MRILIAEDDFTSRCMLAAVLKKAGHDVLQTVNGAEAWSEMQKPDAPRLAILDWMMPELDGVEVLRRIRSLETNRPPYILMLTTRTEKSEIIKGLDAGANDYLAKPFDTGELRARVEVGRRMVAMQDALIESQETLAYQATHDALTGLLNRRSILDLLHKEISRIGRHGGMLAVGMLDIDHFKHFNDTYGHQTGDDVLCEISHFLKEHLREFDAVGRMGGEEFLVITPIPADTDIAFIFDRLCAKIAATGMTTRSGVLSVFVSIGVASTDGANAVDEILTAADAALYRAKDSGRNRVVYADKGVFGPV